MKDEGIGTRDQGPGKSHPSESSEGPPSLAGPDRDQGSETKDTGPLITEDPKLPETGVPRPLEAAPLAYEIPPCLIRSDGGLIRILAEYGDPLARFRKEQIQDTVVFFGSARF